MTEVAHIRINGDTLSITLHGKPYTVGVDHPNFDRISAMLEQGDPDIVVLESLLDRAKAIQAKFDTSTTGIEVKAGQVFYKGTVVHNSVTTRIIEFTEKNLPTRPLILFLDFLMENPSMRAVNELYDFLEKKGMAITSDGYFLAYKGVTADFKDRHSRTFDNSVGSKPSVPRNTVDDDRDRQCSYGLHVGHYEYAKSFAGSDPVMLVKVNPRDAVSVPQDHNCGKLRCCEYEVLRVYENPDQVELPDSLYDARGEEFEAELEEEGSWLSLASPGAWSLFGEDDIDEGEYAEFEEIEPPCADPQKYLDEYDRDNLCRLATERGLFRTIEEARRVGKLAVACYLAKNDLK